MTNHELGYDYNTYAGGPSGVEYEQWTGRLAAIKDGLDRFPVELFADADRAGMLPTADNEMIPTYVLGDFRPSLRDEPASSRLYIGTDGFSFGLYEGGRLQLVPDETGRLAPNDPATLYELSIHKLPPDELEAARTLLQNACQPQAAA